MVLIRTVEDRDVEAVIALYRAVYGDAFPFKEFYDAQWIKKGVYDDDIRWVVAEHEGRLVGSVAVMLDASDADDAVGEVGRLVVHPEARGLDVGTKLVDGLLERMADGVECAFAECRTAHVGAQKIMLRAGYGVVGLEPLAYRIGDRRESVVFVARLFGNARALRRNHPRVRPAAFELATLALRNMGFEPDVLVEPHVRPYPSLRDGREELRVLGRREGFRLLRLSRGARQNPEVFGALRLEHGFLKLKAHDARYLALHRGGTLCAGVGYAYDDLDAKVRIFDVVGADDLAYGTVLELALARIEKEHDPEFLSIDVSAYAPRMQATLELLGFAPVAYVPSMVFAGGERLDVIRMVKLRVSPRLDGLELVPEAAELEVPVERAVLDRVAGVEVDDAFRRVRLFEGLSDVQVGELAACAHELRYGAGEWVFEQGAGGGAMFLVLDGSVDIHLDASAPAVARLVRGEVFGEMALVESLPRSAGVRCIEPARLLVIRPESFAALAAEDPRLGSVVYRNLARVLSERLRKADAALGA